MHGAPRSVFPSSRYLVRRSRCADPSENRRSAPQDVQIKLPTPAFPTRLFGDNYLFSLASITSFWFFSPSSRKGCIGPHGGREKLRRSPGRQRLPSLRRLKSVVVIRHIHRRSRVTRRYTRPFYPLDCRNTAGSPISYIQGMARPKVIICRRGIRNTVRPCEV